MWGKYCHPVAPMGLSPSSDRLNTFTAALGEGLAGIDKSMDHFLAHASSIQGLEDI